MDCSQEASSGLRKEKRTPPPNQGGYRAGKKNTWENATRCAYDIYKGFQKKKHTLAMAVDWEDAYNRVQFKLLMVLLVQYGVHLTLT